MERKWSGLRWHVTSRKRPPRHPSLLHLNHCRPLYLSSVAPGYTAYKKCMPCMGLLVCPTSSWLHFKFHRQGPSWFWITNSEHTGGSWYRICSVNGYSNGQKRSEKSGTLQGRIHSWIKYPINGISVIKVLRKHGRNLTRLKTGGIIMPMTGPCHLHPQPQGLFPSQLSKSVCGCLNREKGC